MHRLKIKCCFGNQNVTPVTVFAALALIAIFIRKQKLNVVYYYMRQRIEPNFSFEKLGPEHFLLQPCWQLLEARLSTKC